MPPSSSSGIINSLPITKIKISLAKVLYKIVVLFFGKRPRVIERNGIKYEVDISEGIDLSLFLFGNFQKHVTNNQFLKINEDAVILDVGANFGIMALQFAKLAKNGRVYAFEPTHYALAKFKKNMSLNEELASRIKITNAFVSDRGEAVADIKAYSSWKVHGEKSEAETHPIHWGTAKSTEGVGSITLNEFCERENLNKVSVIKIDTDGHEYEVLKGAKKAIEKFRPQVIFEVGQYVMQEKGITFEFYHNFFESLNYTIVNSKTGIKITAENYRQVIPQLGTIDALARPN